MELAYLGAKSYLAVVGDTLKSAVLTMRIRKEKRNQWCGFESRRTTLGRYSSGLETRLISGRFGFNSRAPHQIRDACLDGWKGRHGRFKSDCRKAWGFESPSRHHAPNPKHVIRCDRRTLLQ